MPLKRVSEHVVDGAALGFRFAMILPAPKPFFLKLRVRQRKLPPKKGGLGIDWTEESTRIEETAELLFGHAEVL
ncbi:hypothetical protein C7E14_10130 [Stenotrophomonas maltophilia]|nr:hypothetical protein C7E14_10130 [Stenotrophomonas maltophilia]